MNREDYGVKLNSEEIKKMIVNRSDDDTDPTWRLGEKSWERQMSTST